MAAGRVLVSLVLGLWFFSSAVVAFEKEVKPNNYPNFEFHESPVQDTAEVKPHNYGNFQFSETATEGDNAPVAINHEYKPNNYPDFKFTETPEYETQVHGSGDNAHDQFAKGQYNTFNTVLDASETVPSSHETFTAQDDVVFNARQGTTEQTSFETTPTSAQESFYKTGEAEYRGSDASNRYPSSYDLINARNHNHENKAGYETLSSNEVRFTNVHKTQAGAVKTAPVAVHSEGMSGSSRFYTPASDPDFAFRFAKPDATTFGDNAFKADNKADENVYSQFNFDNSEATNDPTATYGTTSPVLAASNVKKPDPVKTAGHGCANMYWAEHTSEWPSFFNVNTQVSQAFGLKAGEIYGTTTLLQALYDNRSDGYSQLLSHGTASLMNAYTMPNYGVRHDAVIDQFLSALASRTTASVQAQKFLNANHAYGPNECLN